MKKKSFFTGHGLILIFIYRNFPNITCTFRHELRSFEAYLLPLSFSIWRESVYLDTLGDKLILMSVCSVYKIEEQITVSP